MNFPLPGVIVDPAHVQRLVTITSATAAGVTPTVYSDPYAVNPVTMPLLISSPTVFYLPNPGRWLVNNNPVTVEGSEVGSVSLGFQSGGLEPTNDPTLQRYVPGLVADHGVTDNQPVLQAFLNGLPNGGHALIPTAASGYGLGSDLLVPAGVHLELEGVGPLKGLGTNRAGPQAAGQLGCATLMPANSITAANNFTTAMVVLNGKAATISGGNFRGYGSSANNDAFRTVYRNAVGTRIRYTVIWGASVICVDDPGQQVAQDGGFIDVVIENNITVPTVTTYTPSATTNTTVTISATTGVAIGSPVLCTNNPAHVPAGTCVTGIAGNVVTMNQSIPQVTTSDNLLFLTGIGGRIAADDNWAVNIHPQYGTWITSSADVQYTNCHFSEASPNAAAVGNLYHAAGQGASYNGCTWDNGANTSSPGHIVRIQGPLTINGGRFQQKAGNNLFPVVLEMNGDTAPTQIVGTSVPNLVTGNAFSALITYQSASKATDVVMGVSAQGTSLTALYSGGTPGVSIGNIINGTLQTVIGGSSLPIATQIRPTDPTGSSSATATYMGLGFTAGSPTVYTPTVSTKLDVSVSGHASAAAATSIMTFVLRYGTGTAPQNGTTTVVGTVAGPQRSVQGPTGDNQDFEIPAVITGLTVGTQYWFDITVVANGTNVVSPKNISLVIRETN